MLDGFFNYSTHIAASAWERRQFLGAWWRMHSHDRRWTPPFHPLLRAALQPGRTPFIERQSPTFVWLEALPGQPNYSGTLSHRQLTSAMMEQPVATALILADPRRHDDTATLALLGCANDVETAERLLGLAMEQTWMQGRSRLLGPTALSPHLGVGLLTSHYHEVPPLYTPYQPPYLPEVLAAVMDPLRRAALYMAQPQHHLTTGPATLRTLTAEDFTHTVPHLLAGLDGAGDFPPPDEAEARFLLDWWGIAPLSGIVAELDGAAVGMVLLQPDLAPALRWAKGGRNPLWRLWFHWRRTRRTRHARMPALVVLPAWRRRGIGAQLWRAGLALAFAHGWQQVSVGPVMDGTPGAAFLLAQGASPQQRYQLYASEG